MRDDDPSDLVHDAFSGALFGDTALGRPILGTMDSITALSRRQIAGYYRRRYTPDVMVVSVAGNVSHDDVVRLVRQALGDRIGGAGEPRTPQHAAQDVDPLPAQPVRVLADETEQANVVLGSRGVSRHDQRRFAVGVLSSALGGGMSSRLFQQVRERRGLAYSVYSFSSMYAETGQFGVYAGCQPDRTDEVLGLIRDELDAAAKGGLTVAEIDRGKGQMRGGIVLGLEDCSSRMTRIGKSELVYGDVMGVDELLGHVDAVTADDVADVAAELLGRPRCLTVVGPFGEHDFDGAV
jgi:predicted Zn-dependent peptidase